LVGASKDVKISFSLLRHRVGGIGSNPSRISCIAVTFLFSGLLTPVIAQTSFSAPPSSETAAETVYRPRYQAAGFLLRAGTVCERESQRTISAAFRILGTAELKTISKNFPETTRKWMTAGADEFNTSVMNSGVAEACSLAATTREKAEETALADQAETPTSTTERRCRVMDPTGTLLNVRTNPNGGIVGTLANGVLVSILDRSIDSRGRSWVYVSEYSSGKPIGWVFREFVSCF
jgi:Bacterial SH3 domain